MIYTLTLNPALDYVVSLSELRTGSINRLEQSQIICGGKGINVSTILTRLNIPNIALGFVAGFTGKALADRLQQQGIRSDFITLSQGMTRINVKIKATQETELNAPGPDIPTWAMSRLLQQLDELHPDDTLVLSGSIPGSLPADTYAQILQHLQGKPLRIVVDAAGEALRQVLPYGPYLIKPNMDELIQLLGDRPSDEAGLLAGGAALQAMGAQNVLLSRAKDGALLLTQQGDIYRVGVCTGQVINSVGAGDAMLAGFLAALPQGHTAALQLATACAGATAFSAGMAERSLIDTLLKQQILIQQIRP